MGGEQPECAQRNGVLHAEGFHDFNQVSIRIADKDPMAAIRTNAHIHTELHAVGAHLLRKGGNIVGGQGEVRNAVAIPGNVLRRKVRRETE